MARGAGRVTRLVLVLCIVVTGNLKNNIIGAPGVMVGHYLKCRA